MFDHYLGFSWRTKFGRTRILEPEGNLNFKKSQEGDEDEVVVQGGKDIKGIKPASTDNSHAGDDPKVTTPQQILVMRTKETRFDT
jgi:hypothetical protein